MAPWKQRALALTLALAGLLITVAGLASTEQPLASQKGLA